MKCAFLLPFLFSLSAFSAANPFIPHWKATCQTGKSVTELSFDSKSGEADSDDMEITMTIGGMKQKLNIKEGLFQTIEFDSESTCDKLPAIVTNDGFLLVLFGVNDRPSPTKIAALVVNLKKQKVEQLIGDIGQAWGKASLNRNAITVSAIHAWKKVQTSDGPENVIGGKLKVSLRKGHVVKEWITKAPSESQ
jgi:hypothetical protein